MCNERNNGVIRRGSCGRLGDGCVTTLESGAAPSGDRIGWSANCLDTPATCYRINSCGETENVYNATSNVYCVASWAIGQGKDPCDGARVPFESFGADGGCSAQQVASINGNTCELGLEQCVVGAEAGARCACLGAFAACVRANACGDLQQTLSTAADDICALVDAGYERACCPTAPPSTSGLATTGASTSTVALPNTARAQTQQVVLAMGALLIAIVSFLMAN